MNRKDLDTWNDLYLSVYGEEQLNEDAYSDLIKRGYSPSAANQLVQRNKNVEARGGGLGQIGAGMIQLVGSKEARKQLADTDTADRRREQTALARTKDPNWKPTAKPERQGPIVPKRIANAPTAPTLPPASIQPVSTSVVATTPARTSVASNPTVASAGVPKVASTKPAGSPMDQWRAANPKLAAAADEKSRIRGTQQTDNPLMKDMKSRLPMNSPSVQAPAVAKLGAGNQSLVNNSNAIKAAPPKPASTVRPGGFGASTSGLNATSSTSSVTAPLKPSTPINSNNKPKLQMNSYKWSSEKTAGDVASAYASIYEAKKKIDQDEDNDNDFADVRIARMIASGVPKAKAIAMVKDKSYNKKNGLDEGIGSAIRGLFSKKKEEKAPKPESRGEQLRKRYDVGPEKSYTSAKRKILNRAKDNAERAQKQVDMGNASQSYADKATGAHNKYLKAGYSKYGADRPVSNGEGGSGGSGRGSKARKRAAAMTANETYEFVASYLLENNFATTIEDADVIIKNMSENWFTQIIEG